MFNKLTHNPGFEIPVNHGEVEYYQGWIDGMVYCNLALEFALKTVIVHYSSRKFSAKVCKQALVDFEGVIDICREKGCVQAVITNPEPDDKWVRFIKLFGFGEPAQVIISSRRI